MGGRVRDIVHEEVNGVHPPLVLATWLSGVLPDLVANRLRTSLLRAAGLRIGRGTVFGGKLRVTGGAGARERISIGANGWINARCYFDASDEISVGDDVAIAQDVMILTQTHHIGSSRRRAGVNRTAPVRIGNGCWIGARAVILPGVSVGDGAVVAAGAVVARDVAPDELVGGIPASRIRHLE